MKSDRLFELLADKTDKDLLHWAKDNDMPDTFNLKLDKYMIQMAFDNPPRLAILNWSNYLVAAFQHPALERVYELARRSAMHASGVIDCLIKELESMSAVDDAEALVQLRKTGDSKAYTARIENEIQQSRNKLGR